MSWCVSSLLYTGSRTGKTGKQGIWMFIFPDMENTGNFPKNIKNKILHSEIYLQHIENF